jgi:hypothetical protein
MLYRSSIGAIALTAVLIAATGALAHDESKYPDWKGGWIRRSAGNFDPGKPPGLAQQAPLTPEYQKILEASVADQAAGGQGNNPMGRCIPPGMPRMMLAYGLGLEFVITPQITYIFQGEPMDQLRRVRTDGRSFPEHIDPSYSGHSIGRWEDTNGDGRFDTLAIETRFIKLPRSYDSSGMPFHNAFFAAELAIVGLAIAREGA